MSLFKATDATTNAIHADADLGIRVHNLLEPDDSKEQMAIYHTFLSEATPEFLCELETQWTAEERDHLKLSNMREHFSARRIVAELTEAAVAFGVTGALCPVPQSLPANAPLSNPQATFGVLNVGLAAYGPKLSHVKNKHTLFDMDGHVEARSFTKLEMGGRAELERCGVADKLQLVTANRLPLLGGMVHVMADADPCIHTVGTHDGGRQDADLLAKRACSNPHLRAVRVEKYAVIFEEAKQAGWTSLLLVFFSDPSLYLGPIIAEAAERAGMPVEVQELPNRLATIHPEVASDASNFNFRTSGADTLDVGVRGLASRLIRYLGGTVSTGEGYFAKFLREHSAWTDDQKSEKQKCIKPHAKAAVAKKQSNDAAEAARAPGAGLAEAKAAVAAAKVAAEAQARAETGVPYPPVHA